jgi:hypothetical protein
MNRSWNIAKPIPKIKTMASAEIPILRSQLFPFLDLKPIDRHPYMLLIPVNGYLG